MHVQKVDIIYLVANSLRVNYKSNTVGLLCVYVKGGNEHSEVCIRFSDVSVSFSPHFCACASVCVRVCVCVCVNLRKSVNA